MRTTLFIRFAYDGAHQTVRTRDKSKAARWIYRRTDVGQTSIVFRKKKDQTQFLNIENLQIILAWNPILEPGSTTKRFKMNKIKQYLHIEALN